MALLFEFKVLGDFSVRRDGAAVVLPQSRKTRALLAYLAVQEKPQRRERLCELFWDIPDDPRGSLRWSLAKLRPILNADGETRLEADRNMVHLVPGSVRLDYDLIRGLVPETIDALPTDRLEAIATAFSGSFLSDLYLPRCQAFEAWRVYCANETEILRLKTLRALINRLADEPERALIHAHVLQSLLPDEDLGKEIAGLSKRARKIVTAQGGRKLAAPDEASLPATEIASCEARSDRRPAAPTVMHACCDRVTPVSESLTLARTIIDARFLELDSTNHILLADEPAFRDCVTETTALAGDVLHSPAVAPIGHRTRRQATILSASFISSSEPADDLLPEAALAVIDPLLTGAAETVRANGGIILHASENGLTASFGAPEPLEDHAAFACRAALELRKLAANEATSPIRICMALDTGNVVLSAAVGCERSKVRGGPVSVAHAISQALRREVVIATERAQAAADGFVTMRKLTSLAVPGYPKNQALYEVMQINRGRSRWQLRAERQLSPFVGREMQLQMLNKAWHDTCNGEGQTVMIIGDPGLGKSRITHEFVGAIPQIEVENLVGGALEQDLRSGFAVIRKVLQGLFGTGDTEASAAAVERISAAWSARKLDQRLLDPILAVMELPSREPLWTTLAGPERSRRMQEAAVALLMSLSRTKPVVLLVEDLHWIDLESEAILTRLAEALPAVRFLLILTCRPDYDREVFSAARAVEIRLSGLNPTESGALIDFLIGRDAGLDHLRRNLSEVCRGNALFLEETVRNLAETDKLEGQPGHYRLAGKVGEVVVSSNIHSIIDARFERMDNDAKHVAEIASIFGGDIPRQLLRRMAALPEARFDAALRSLRNADLLVEVQVFPDASLRFKHVLIRNAISDRILSPALVDLHRTALTELKACYADRLEEHSERLARHAQLAQLWDDAAGYLLISAQRAIKRSAHASALDQLDLGIELLRANNVAASDEREIDFQLARGAALMAARGRGSTEVLGAFQRAEELCRKIGDRMRLFTALRGRAQYYMLSGKPASAEGAASPASASELMLPHGELIARLGDVADARAAREVL